MEDGKDLYRCRTYDDKDIQPEVELGSVGQQPWSFVKNIHHYEDFCHLARLHNMDGTERHSRKGDGHEGGECGGNHGFQHLRCRGNRDGASKQDVKVRGRDSGSEVKREVAMKQCSCDQEFRI